MSGINFIGIVPQGRIEKDGDMETYYMSEEEVQLQSEGKIAVIGTTTYVYGPKGSYAQHEYSMVDMTKAISVDIFYDTEDDYMMDQTIKFNNGESIYGRSRNHEEVKKWEALGIPITKSYGY